MSFVQMKMILYKSETFPTPEDPLSSVHREQPALKPEILRTFEHIFHAVIQI